jgi:hypothetical protein
MIIILTPVCPSPPSKHTHRQYYEEAGFERRPILWTDAKEAVGIAIRRAELDEAASQVGLVGLVVVVVAVAVAVVVVVPEASSQAGPVVAVAVAEAAKQVGPSVAVLVVVVMMVVVVPASLRPCEAACLKRSQSQSIKTLIPEARCRECVA